jgi:hypothetical protein
MAVTDTNYAELWDLTALASQGYGLSDKGMWQTDLIAQLTEMETNFNAVLTKLDSDGGVTDVNYNTLWAVDLDNTVVGSKGLDQDKMVTFLQQFITNLAGLTAKLDADGGVTDTDYATNCDMTDVVNAGVNFTIAANENLAVDNTGFQQGALYDLLNSAVTKFNTLTAQLDADS